MKTGAMLVPCCYRTVAMLLPSYQHAITVLLPSHHLCLSSFPSSSSAGSERTSTPGTSSDSTPEQLHFAYHTPKPPLLLSHCLLSHDRRGRNTAAQHAHQARQ